MKFGGSYQRFSSNTDLYGAARRPLELFDRLYDRLPSSSISSPFLNSSPLACCAFHSTICIKLKLPFDRIVPQPKTDELACFFSVHLGVFNCSALRPQVYSESMVSLYKILQSIPRSSLRCTLSRIWTKPIIT